MDNPERYTVVEGATKVGKTAPLIIWLLEQALKGKAGHNFWWVAPIRSQAKIAFDRMKAQIGVKNFFTDNKSELTLTLPTGSVIHFKSADNPDSLYGEDVYACVFDEASRAKESAWFAIRSTLTSTKGKCKFIANVRGRGWYYKLAQKAKNGGDPEYAYRKVTCWDAVMTGGLDPEEVTRNRSKIFAGADDPDDVKRAQAVYDKLLAYAYAPLSPKDVKNRLSLAEVLQAKSDVPAHVFRELYEAEPSDDGGNPFGVKNLDRAKRSGLAAGPIKSLGVDLASTTDFTVEIGLNNDRAVCLFNRYQLDWELTTTNLSKLPDVPTGVDSTGVGKPILERMQKGRKHTEGFVFTGSSKQRLIEALATAFQMGEITFPEGGPLEDELYSFEYTHTRTGVRYSAPEGLHDDCVMALALAYDQHRHQPVQHKRPTIKIPQRKQHSYFS
ncbi:hypothetical protein GCM10028809_49810 [Spirosoma gilvum]